MACQWNLVDLTGLRLAARRFTFQAMGGATAGTTNRTGASLDGEEIQDFLLPVDSEIAST